MRRSAETEMRVFRIWCAISIACRYYAKFGTKLASNARVDTHRAFCKFQPCCSLQKLVGETPQTPERFFKIGCAPAELNITLFWTVI